MKSHGKGQGISINGGTSHINHYKQQLAETPPLPVHEFRPLTGYVLPRQEEREQYAAIPSKAAK